MLFVSHRNNMKLTSVGNIVVSLLEICRAYQTDFLRNAKKVFVNPPPRLRCGIARGRVVSVGDGSDFVGSCINVAARLQKLGKLSFAFSRRGFDPKVCFSKVWRKDFVTRRVSIRGVGEDEMVVILKKELKSLGPKDASQFERV
jgi:class 3 adenylate cyclase